MLRKLLLAASLLYAVPAHAETNFPKVAVGPIWGIRFPFQIIGFGVGTNVHVPHLVNVFAQAQYGISLGDAGNNSSSWNLWAEAYAGYPLFEWSSDAKLAEADSQSTSGNTRTTYYHNETTETSEMITLEGGVNTGDQLFAVANAADPMNPGTLSFSKAFHRTYYLEAGVRYAYAWDSGDHDRNMNVFWLHAIAPALGVPSEPSGGGRSVFGGLSSSEARPVKTRPAGIKAGGSIVMWKNGFATLDFEVGYLPGPDAWLVGFGNTFPFWF